MNYVGDHNLNLIGKVALVYGASSPTGAAVCRTLLNSNAFVLGIDSVPAHESTRCARGSHFQFFQHDAGKGFGWEEVLRYSREMFCVEKVDFLVLVGHGGAEARDLKDVLKALEGSEGGVVLVGGENGGGGEKVIERARELRGRLKGAGVRYNVIFPQVSFTSPEKPPAVAGLQDHIDAYSLKRKEGGYKLEHAREVANVALFLFTEQGKSFDGKIIGSNGACAII